MTLRHNFSLSSVSKRAKTGISTAAIIALAATGSVTVPAFAAGEAVEAEGCTIEYEDDTSAVDHDCDGLPVEWEDYYGTSDENVDTDGDGLTDFLEVYGFAEGTGQRWNPYPTGLFEDDDNNPIPGTTDPTKEDTDEDGLSDGLELGVVLGEDGRTIADPDFPENMMPSDPNVADADEDEDGLFASLEAMLGTSDNDVDSDDDGLDDYYEYTGGFNVNFTENTYAPELPEGIEDPLAYYRPAGGTNPMNPDTDGDGITDGEELQATLSENENRSVKADETGANDTDPNSFNDKDNDGLGDGLEATIGTDPESPDSDNDGVSDYAEVYGTVNPFKEGFANEDFEAGNTNPLAADTDEDGISDGEELNVKVNEEGQTVADDTKTDTVTDPNEETVTSVGTSVTAEDKPEGVIETSVGTSVTAEDKPEGVIETAVGDPVVVPDQVATSSDVNPELKEYGWLIGLAGAGAVAAILAGIFARTTCTPAVTSSLPFALPRLSSIPALDKVLWKISNFLGLNKHC